MFSVDTKNAFRKLMKLFN